MFSFKDPGPLIDDDLELVLMERTPADPDRNWVPAYKFEMRLRGTETTVGHIQLRVGNTEHLVRYGGHFGYGVNEEHRGRRYAARSVALLLPLAREHGLDPVWITCDPGNIASRRTCELAGGELVEIVDLPPDTDLYQRGRRQGCRYRLKSS